MSHAHCAPFAATWSRSAGSIRVPCGGRTARGGKNGIAVPSFDKVPLVIDILITAVRNGELDNQLAQAKKPPRTMTSRKAA